MNDLDRVKQSIERASNAEKRTALTTRQSLVKWMKEKGLGHLIDAILNFIFDRGWDWVKRWLAGA